MYSSSPYFPIVDKELSQAMGRYWYSFAKHGDPNVARMGGSPRWPAYSNASDHNIVFDKPIRSESGLRRAQCEVCAKTLSCQGPPGS